MSNFPKSGGHTCAVTMCQNPASAVSPYCNTHRQRVAKTGHPTTKAIDLRRGDGLDQRTWISNFMEDDIKTNESLAESLAWFKCWVSQQAKNPSKGQHFFQRMYNQMDDEGYLKVVSGVATLVANHLHSPSSIEAGLPLLRQTGFWTLFGATKPTSKTEKAGSVRATSYYAGAPILDKVGQTILDEMGKDLSYLAQRAVKLSPYFARSKKL